MRWSGRVLAGAAKAWIAVGRLPEEGGPVLGPADPPMLRWGGKDLPRRRGSLASDQGEFGR